MADDRSTRPHCEVGDPVIGVIGLGAMGRPMAVHLLADHQVLFWTRSEHADLAAKGAQQCAQVAELARRADAILFMVPDLPQVTPLLPQLLAGARQRTSDQPSLLLLIGCTCSAVGVRDLGAELARQPIENPAQRVQVADTPVSGGQDGAEAGTLSIMVGGDPEPAERACKILSACGHAVRLGPLGAGEVAKACNQLVVSATIMALGEATVLAERSGIDVRQMWDLLDAGYASSRLLDSRKERFITGDDSPSGQAKYLLKDLGIGLEVAQATGTNAAMLPALHEMLDELVHKAGLGERDMATSRRFIEQR